MSAFLSGLTAVRLAFSGRSAPCLVDFVSRPLCLFPILVLIVRHLVCHGYLVSFLRVVIVVVLGVH